MTAPDLLAAMFSILLLCCSFIVRPQHARCPEHHDLRMGIRRSGEFQCWATPSGPVEYDGTWERRDRSKQSGAILTGRLWCTNGTSPIVVNERVVGCQR